VTDLKADLNQNDELVFLPLGGCGEIGMNFNVFGFGPAHDRKWIIVDVGVTFGDETTPGVDLIMADPGFIADLKDDLLGIILTHGHEDHIGAVPHLWPFLQCPVYATPFTASLVRSKLVEKGIMGEVPFHEVDLDSRFSLGPFDIELVTLTHSILEPNGLILRTALGTIFHTGDWKIDPDPVLGNTTDAAKIQALGEEGVLAMICDSTNVFVEGESGSEADVRTNLVKVVGEQTGRVALTTFASNVARLDSAFNAARKNNRHVCLVGRSMIKIVAAAKDNGYLEDFTDFVDERDAGYLPRDKVLYVCTGSQGEDRAALGRIARGDHKHVSLETGDTAIFSSRIIPGNERGINALQEMLVENGVKVITADDEFIHVSGHPCRDELAQMYQWVRPEICVPVHGEMRHLREHSRLAKTLQVPQIAMSGNGGLIRLAPGPAEIIDEVPSGRLHLDGNILVPAGSGAMRDRKKTALQGVIFAALVMTDSGDLLDDARITGVGLPDVHGASGRTLFEAIGDDVTKALDEMLSRDLRDDSSVEQRVRRTIRSRLKSAWGKRPQILVEIFRVDD
jgi:ribonuclease J